MEDNVVCEACVDRNRSMGLFYRNALTQKASSFADSSVGDVSPTPVIPPSAEISQANVHKQPIEASTPAVFNANRPTSRLPVLHPSTNVQPTSHRQPIKQKIVKLPPERLEKRINMSLALSNRKRTDGAMQRRMVVAEESDSDASDHLSRTPIIQATMTGKKRRMSYVAREDKEFVEKVEGILGEVVKGSAEEWERAGERRGSVIRSPPNTRSV